MKLILSEYVRSLKERAEFDRLLPDLLLAMNYVPISKPQVGVRQYGVDLATVGKDEEGIDELLLLVIKRGDITRANWDSGPQAVRQSLNDVIDVYLKTHLEPSHEALNKRIVVAATGDLKQEVQINWDGYVKNQSAIVKVSFWGADRIAILIGKFLLDENIFASEDRMLLRKALALSGDIDYDRRDLYQLLRRQLHLSPQGQIELKQTTSELRKSLRTVNLSTQIFSRWSEDEGNLKQGLIASERAMLWSWHRITRENGKAGKLDPEFRAILRSYVEVGRRYFEKVRHHLAVQDGLSGYCHENAELAVTVFEQIGLLATIGLVQSMADDDDASEENIKNSDSIASSIVDLLKNNPVSGSPRFDHNVVDVTLGLLLLISTGFKQQAKDWLAELVTRIDFALKIKRNFPISIESFDDLAEVTRCDDDELRSRFMKTSWFIPTLAGWSIILDRDDLYDILVHNTRNNYPEVCLQLWHPTSDCTDSWYFASAADFCGEVEAPILLPDTAIHYKERMQAILTTARLDVTSFSSACTMSKDPIDLVACRHFRTPVPPSFWYSFLDAAIS